MVGMRTSSYSKTVKREADSDMSDPLNPYYHTTGRWMHRDKLQRELRYIKFDFSALCRQVLEKSPGAQKITRYEKKDGYSNRVFIFYLDNGSRVVAKLPFRIAGPVRLTTNSEVATMAYIREQTQIPLPAVLDWDDNSANPIGSEYIIMEHASGIQLSECWPSMDTVQHMRCIEALSNSVIEMANLSFPAYGSLYFDGASIDPQHKLAFGKFCIGPHCGVQYWDCSAGDSRFYHQTKPNKGPWSNLREYCSALIDTGVSRLPPVGNAPKNELSYRGSVGEHLRLLRISESVIEKLINTPLIQNISAPTLLHPNLHRRNIFVSADDPSSITALIDWQSTSIDPTFTFADRTPDMIEPPVLLTLPVKMPGVLSKDEESTEDAGTAEDITLIPGIFDSPLTLSLPITAPATVPDDSIDDSETLKKEAERRKKDISISRQTFEVYMHTWAPKLQAARTIDKTLLSPFDCHLSWESSAAALRQELIELSQRWTELGLSNACPYQPADKELSEHAKQYDDYNAVQSLRVFLMGALDTTDCGWIPLERWEEARGFHRELFQTWIKTCAREEGDPEMNKEKGEKMWPFDDAKRKTR